MFMVLTSWLRVIAWVHTMNAEQRQLAADFIDLRTCLNIV